MIAQCRIPSWHKESTRTGFASWIPVVFVVHGPRMPIHYCFQHSKLLFRLVGCYPSSPSTTSPGSRTGTPTRCPTSQTTSFRAKTTFSSVSAVENDSFEQSSCCAPKNPGAADENATLQIYQRERSSNHSSVKFPTQPESDRVFRIRREELNEQATGTLCRVRVTIPVSVCPVAMFLTSKAFGPELSNEA